MYAPSVRVSCSGCGEDAIVTVVDIHVHMIELGSDGTYSFECPLCSVQVVREAPGRTLRMLVNIGVEYSLGAPSPELNEVRGRGLPIDYDEVIEFHHTLEDEAIVKRNMEELVKHYG